MNRDALRAFCLSFPGASEDVQWGNDLLYRVGGEKIFLFTNLEPAEIRGITIKCSPEEGAELMEREGIERAAYIGRYGWITIRDMGAVKPAELRRLIADSYAMVFAKLPARLRAGITANATGAARQ